MTERFLHVPEGHHACLTPPAALGTVWECSCGDVWVFEWVPTRRRGGLVTLAHSEWRRERWWERRRRLRRDR